MSIDEKAEEQAYAAMTNLAAATRSRPKERRRVCREVVKMVAQMCGWEVTLPEETPR